MARSIENSKNLSLNFLNHDIEKGSVIYVINVSEADCEDSWQLRVRYSTLRELHNKMKNYNKEMPNFPGKKFMGNLNPTFITQRQSGQAHYLNVVLKYPEKYKNEILYNYLLKDRKPIKNDYETKTHSNPNENKQPEETIKLKNSEKHINPKYNESQELYKEFKVKLMQIAKKNEMNSFIDEEDKNTRAQRCIYIQEKQIIERNRTITSANRKDLKPKEIFLKEKSLVKQEASAEKICQGQNAIIRKEGDKDKIEFIHLINDLK